MAVKQLGVKTFVETGTFRGDSLEFFAIRYPNVQCYSCDISPVYAGKTKSRLRDLPNVHVWGMDSLELLRRMSYSGKPPFLFWLDAHSLSDWSTHVDAEVAFIRQNHMRGKVLIDDYDKVWKGEKLATIGNLVKVGIFDV